MKSQARKNAVGARGVSRKPAAMRASAQHHNSGVQRGQVILGIICCSLIILAAANLQAISTFVNRPIVKVKMENQWVNVAELEVSQMAASYMGTGFFGFDVNGLKSEVERHPWVRQAAVKRVWPDSVALQIQERVAIARWGEGQLLSQQGEKFSPTRFGDAGRLPKLNGPDGSQARVMQQFQFLNELFSPADLRLSELTLSERGSWELVVDDRIAISAGREKLIERVNRFISFYQQETGFDRIAIREVDLRYDNGLAIARIDESLPGVAIR